LHENGLMEQVPLDLRRHIVVKATVEEVTDKLWAIAATPVDLIWLKVTGAQSELAKLNKKELGQKLFGHSNYKLDLIPLDREQIEVQTEKMSEGEILDTLIDSTAESAEHKTYLKSLWREII
jgi:hypothetical protein